MTNLLDIKNLGKIYDKQARAAVDSLDFKLNKGEIVGLLGLNGAGKTTCIKMIAGLIYPTSGKIKFWGKDISEFPNKARRHIGYLPEGNPLWEDATPKEYLFLRASLLNLSSKNKQIEEITELTEINEVMNIPIAELSSGYRQRVGLSATFLGWPELLLLDEPARGLDPIQIESLNFLIKEASKKSTILISSHVLDELERTASRFIILKQGKLISDQKISETISLREYFLKIHKDNQP